MTNASTCQYFRTNFFIIFIKYIKNIWLIITSVPNLTSILFAMSTEVKRWFSAAEIAMLGRAFVAGLPMSERGATRRAKQHQWTSQIVPGKGGKGGVKTEYMIPQEVRTIVHSFLKENPGFFSEAKEEVKDKPYSKPYPVSKATALTLKSPEPAHIVTVIDTQTMIFVMVSVDSLIAKKGINIDPVKKAELILLIYDYCKGTGICNEDIVSKFLKLAG